MSIRAASRAAEISDTSIHLWDHAGVTPLSFWKLCWLQFAPHEKPTTPDVLTVELPFKVTESMLDSAERFDRQFRGLAPTVRDGVRSPLTPAREFTARRPRGAKARDRASATAMKAVAPRPRLARPTPTPAPAPVATPTPVPAPAPIAPSLRTSTEEVEVLLALLVQVTAQRDQLTHRVYLLETQRRSEDQLRARIVELERELVAFKELADAATAPSASTVLPAKVEPRAAERVEALLKSRAPSLVDELRNLPRSAVVS